MDNNQEAEDVVLLQWKYTPTDYFEDTKPVSRSGYKLNIEGGTAEARIEPTVYEKNPSMRDELHAVVNARFRGVQLMTHRPYQLGQPSYSRLYPDGSRDVTISFEPDQVICTDHAPDLMITDQHGNVISDTCRDRMERQETISDLVEKYSHRDPLVESLLGFYAAAVSDPANELVHLYDIRDAIANKFDNHETARTAIDISKTKWNIFGRLTNKTPLRQGRHRGNFVDRLRDATPEELDEARSIARSFIEGYLNYLTKQDRP